MENITVAEDLNYELSVFSPNKRQAAWDAVNRALTAASLQDQILDPGQRAEGLLIFRLPPETGSVAVTLGGWLSDGEARPLSIRSEAAVPLNRAKWKPTPEVRCSRFDDTRVIGEFQITTGPPVWSSTSSSHLSHTSGCEKEPADPDDAQAYRFISAMDSGLMAEAAQAQGPRVTALASLMGCDEGARSGFVELMRMRFDTIYPDAWPRPDVVLNTLRVEMEHDAVLATCRPGMLFTEPSLTP